MIAAKSGSTDGPRRISTPARIVCGTLGVALIVAAVVLSVIDLLAGDSGAIPAWLIAGVVGAWLTHLAAKGEYSTSRAARARSGEGATHLGRVARWFCGISGAAMLALLGWRMLDGGFPSQEVLLLGVAIGAGLLVAAFTGSDPTSDEVIPPASERFLELADPQRTIDAGAMTSGPPRADAVREPAPVRRAD